MLKSSLSQSSEFSGLNDDEIKRIMSVIERDFQLRQKEFQRIQELKKVIRQEHERVEYLAGSKEFNSLKCIRCFKSFQIFFRPKEVCSECKLNVCHNCSIYNNQTKTWQCQICLKLKELETLTADWFYKESGRKYKRCGSSKVVQELYKREKELSVIDEDLGYGTLRKTLSADSANSYVVHDKNLISELDEYSKRLNFLIDNLQSDLSEKNKNKVNLKDYQQQIASEITRARTALSGPLRRSNKKFHVSYEIDLQNVIIQKTAEILQTNLQEFKRGLTKSNFDQNLAQIILNKFVKKDSRTSKQQLLVPSTRNNFSSLAWELTSRQNTFRKMNLSKTTAVDEEDTEKEEDDESEERTPTESSIEDQNHIDSKTNQKSNERVVHWKANRTLIKSKTIPSNKDEQEDYSTWL